MPRALVELDCSAQLKSKRIACLGLLAVKMPLESTSGGSCGAVVTPFRALGETLGAANLRSVAVCAGERRRVRGERRVR